MAPTLEPTAPPTRATERPNADDATAHPAPTTAPTSDRRPAAVRRASSSAGVERHLSQLGGFGAVTVDGQAVRRRLQGDQEVPAPVRHRAGARVGPGRPRSPWPGGWPTPTLANCDAGKGLTICVDLTHQTVWAMRGGEVVLGPTVTRTGMSGFRTPAGSLPASAGATSREWSNPYEVWLPYWQQFHGGMGFHETTTYIHNSSLGSHGCVNLLPGDARRLWDLAKVGTRVHVFGGRTT